MSHNKTSGKISVTREQAAALVYQFVCSFNRFSPDEAQAIANHLDVRVYPKGAVLVREGEVSNQCYFVIKGCLRQYMIADSTEHTVQFFMENEAAVLFSSYAGQQSSKHFLVCAEDVVLIVGEPEKENSMYAAFPKLQELTRAMLETDFGKVQDEAAWFRSSTPEERYLRLLRERPGLVQRVPQHQLASYLGITPESLSRIRARLSRQQRPSGSAAR